MFILDLVLLIAGGFLTGVYTQRMLSEGFSIGYLAVAVAWLVASIIRIIKIYVKMNDNNE